MLIVFLEEAVSLCFFYFLFLLQQKTQHFEAFFVAKDVFF